MFITELFESQERRLVVVYPGRFQPFHLGHKDVFADLQARFGNSNVYIGTSAKVELPKSPFSFADKLTLMNFAGVPSNYVLEVTDTYKVGGYQQALNLNLSNTVMIFALGAPDAERLEVDAVYTEFTLTGRKSKIPDGKVVGDAKPLKTFQSFNECVTADQHQYVVIAHEREKSVVIDGVKYDASHGTECRNLWNEVRHDPAASAEFLTQLYGRSAPELANIFNKIPDTNAAPIEEPKLTKQVKLQPVKVAKTVKEDAVDENQVIDKDTLIDIYVSGRRKGRVIKLPVAQGVPNSMLDAITKRLELKYNINPKTIVYGPSNIDEAGSAQQAAIAINMQDHHQKPKSDDVSEDAAGVGVVRGGKDPRYMTATMGLQNAVDGNTLGKEMKAFFPTKPPKTQQLRVNTGIGKGLGPKIK